MLSALLTGTDIDGDKWTLRLIGPGTLNVSNSAGKPFTNATANDPASIDTITVSGTDSILSRLVGTVQKGPKGDGRVFFQFLRESGGGENGQVDLVSPNGTKNPPQPKNGLLAVIMPDFWLGNTRGTIPTAPTSFTGPGTADVGMIDIPDGTSTLSFGGVDTTYTPPGGKPLNQDKQNDRFQVNLGTPYILGTSIIVNRVITDAQAGTPASGTTPAGRPTQDTVYFQVAGRLSLFQANSIDGNSTLVPDQFTATAGATATTTPGGTFVISGTGTPPFFFNGGSPTGALTGQIGNVRIGGNATNFSTMVFDATTSTSAGNARISNFSVGGETSHVLLVAPNGARNVYFGKGMDQVQINSELIHALQANRGALDSTVTTTRGIESLVFGGDAVNTNVQSGYDLGNFNTLIQGVAASGSPVPTITNRLTSTNNGFLLPSTINAGHINARVAGDVINSVFSASVEPNPSFNAATDPGVFTQPKGNVFPFGTPSNIVYTRGQIHAKVEGKIDNSNNALVDASQPKQAFFAKTVDAKVGPIVPPNVPEAPYYATVYHRGQRGVPRIRVNPLVAHPAGPRGHTTGKKK